MDRAGLVFDGHRERRFIFAGGDRFQISEDEKARGVRCLVLDILRNPLQPIAAGGGFARNSGSIGLHLRQACRLRIA